MTERKHITRAKELHDKHAEALENSGDNANLWDRLAEIIYSEYADKKIGVAPEQLEPTLRSEKLEIIAGLAKAGYAPAEIRNRCEQFRKRCATYHPKSTTGPRKKTTDSVRAVNDLASKLEPLMKLFPKSERHDPRFPSALAGIRIVDSADIGFIRSSNSPRSAAAKIIARKIGCATRSLANAVSGSKSHGS